MSVLVTNLMERVVVAPPRPPGGGCCRQLLSRTGLLFVYVAYLALGAYMFLSIEATTAPPQLLPQPQPQPPATTSPTAADVE